MQIAIDTIKEDQLRLGQLSAQVREIHERIMEAPSNRKPALYRKLEGTLREFTQIESGMQATQRSLAGAVRAVAAVTDTPYKKVLHLMSKAGRADGRGTTWAIAEKALVALGFTAEHVPPDEFLAACPPRWNAQWVTAHHPARVPKAWRNGKNYLLVTHNRLLPVIDGVNLDRQSSGRPMRVLDIYEVHRRSKT